MANNQSLSASINLVDLDFASLKQSFITYLRNQDAFLDYDFEGSNLNLLCDLLAYNSFKNCFYLNMAISEGFLDSAQMRNSLLSHAKELNYQPRSIRSSRANITVNFEATGESQPYTIPKGSQFSSLVKGTQYTFSLPETLIVSSANTSFSFTSDIYEGVFKKDSYVFLDNVENQRFKITNKNVDTRSITVTVFEDNAEIGDIYKITNTLLDLNETSKVFFLQTSETGHYEVFFGDDNLGKQPKINSVILIDYHISNGAASNGARAFSVDFEPTATNELLSAPELEVNAVAENGIEAETNESVRYYAPRHFQVQERAITTLDYEVLLKNQFPEINAVEVHGGEHEDPPQFGRVFISVDLVGVDGLPEAKKDEYYAFIKRRASMSIDPVFVEPQYLYAAVDTIVRYNINITTNSQNRIRTLVTDAIIAYQTANLDDFNAILRHSQLSSEIDAADVSIISNILDVKVYKKYVPLLGVTNNVVLDFNLPLMNMNHEELSDKYRIGTRTSITSSYFRYNGIRCLLQDNDLGIIRIMTPEGGFLQKIINVGTVDYGRGQIKLNMFKPDGYDGLAIKIYATPRDQDISSSRNTIFTIEPDEIHVTPEVLRL